MSKKKGFWKERYDRPHPIIYEVEFESGWIEEVKAKSAYEARQKTHSKQVDYGFIEHCTPKQPPII